ncbi:MAG TPA: GNAT family N-acetyltransferase [Acidimicrobiales bacterium]|nr:GNAT family N-acetyltransferase [Acidimicrobiales bacterium]
MVVLRGLTDHELSDFLVASRASYLAARIANGDDPGRAADAIDDMTQAMFPGGVPAEGHVVCAIDEDGVRVGSLWIGPAEDQPDVLWVWDIEIGAEHRGRGLGRQAMLLAEQLARSFGARELGLNVFGGNLVARHLYESLGFEPRRIFMTKVLRGTTDGDDDDHA